MIPPLFDPYTLLCPIEAKDGTEYNHVRIRSEGERQ